MRKRPLVSVIMPFYNTPPQFMIEAIESVLNQDYSNWEILLVDDGSSNDSTAVAQKYAKQYAPKVRYLEHEGHQNRGASTSRQLGISQANGSYIALLDADDVWLPHKLKEQVSILEAHSDVAMLYGNTRYWYSWTGDPEDLKHDYLPKLGIRPNTLVDPPGLVPLYLEGKAAVPCTCSVLVRYEIIESVGGFENAFPGMYDDQVFYTKICLEAPVFVAGECWDWYRQHSNSCCAVAARTGQNSATRLFYLNWLEEYLSNRGITDSEVWQAVRRQLWCYREPTQALSVPTRYAVRWTKKWLLRSEEFMLPPVIRRRLWSK